MTLWTPDGEVPVDRTKTTGSADTDTGDADDVVDPTAVADALGIPDLDALSPEDRERAEKMVAEMAEVQRQIVDAPAAQILANHVIGIYELAAIHLSQDEPKFGEARLAIDALAAVLEAVGDRLETVAPGLTAALTQVQMAFVQRKEEVDEGSA